MARFTVAKGSGRLVTFLKTILSETFSKDREKEGHAYLKRFEKGFECAIGWNSWIEYNKKNNAVFNFIWSDVLLKNSLKPTDTISKFKDIVLCCHDLSTSAGDGTFKMNSMHPVVRHASIGIAERQDHLKSPVRTERHMPYALHPTPYILTLCPTPYALHPAPYALRSTHQLSRPGVTY